MTSASRTRKTARSLADRLEASPGLYLVVFTLIYALGMIANNSRRSLWIDELFTSYLADLPSITQIWPLIEKGIELNPPLPFWLTWMIHHSIGQGEILTRLPATIGFWAMCICLFYFVRRRSDALHGFLALLLPLFTFTSSDATFARGYGLLLGFSGLALLSWQHAAERVRRSLALAGLVIGIAGAVSCHYYGLYVAGAIGLGELVRAKDRRRLDLPVFAALAVGVSPLLAYASLVRTAKRGLATFWADPQGDFIYQSYADLLGPVSIVLFLFMLTMLWKPHPQAQEEQAIRWTPSALPRHETIACAALLAMPAVVYVAALMDLAAFYPRYVQPVVLGFTIMASMFAYRIGGGNRTFRNASIGLVVWLCLAPWFVWQEMKFMFPMQPGAAFLNKINTAVAPDLPLVIDSDSDFMSVYHYASPKLRERLFMLDDAAASVRYRGSDTGMRSLEVGQTFRDLHVVDYHQFVQTHPVFLVVRTRPTSWIVQALMADGAKVELLDYHKDRRTFTEEALMFKIQSPVSSVARLSN